MMAEPLLLQAGVQEVLAGRHLVIYFPRLAGGGAERLYLDLAPAFQRAGLRVTILVDRHDGELAGTMLPPGLALQTLGASRTLTALPRLAFYLRRVQPDIVLSAISVNHVPLLWARFLAGRKAGRRVRVVVSQHNTLSAEMTRSLTFRVLPWLYRMFFWLADAIVAVSHGVAGDLAHSAGIARDRIVVIHNGVVDTGFLDRAAAPCPHHWYAQVGNRIFLAVGRLTAQKDFSTLLKAFAAMPADPSVKLVILGEGPLRGALLAEASSLGIASRVDLPGFVSQPLPYMARAQALVLSSRYEGFGLVLAEALACGTQIVSTDCPHGPAEILEDGRFGWLVPVADPDALAAAMTAALHTQPERSALMARGQVFSISRCAADYLRLFAGLPHGFRTSTLGLGHHPDARTRGAAMSLTD